MHASMKYELHTSMHYLTYLSFLDALRHTTLCSLLWAVLPQPGLPLPLPLSVSSARRLYWVGFKM